MAVASGQRNTRHGELKEMLLREIRNSGINTRLPSENELSRQFGVCRATVNKVMVELERERYIIRRRGKGTFVIPRDQKLENGNPLLGGGRIVSVYPDFFSYSDWEMTHRIELAALKNNCELVSLKLQPDSDLESLFELLEREERIAGAIIRIGFNLTGTLVKRLEAAGIPMVVLLPPPPEFGGKLAFVYGDNRRSGYLKMECLLRHGHRRIGYVSDQPLQSAGVLHLEGVKQALYEYKLNYRDLKRSELRIWNWSNPLTAGYRIAADLLDRYDLTALLTDSLPGAFGALRVLYERGLNCPGDVSIVTVGKFFGLEELGCPALTTTEVPGQQVVDRAFELLLKPGQGGLVNPIEPVLVERESVRDLRGAQ